MRFRDVKAAIDHLKNRIPIKSLVEDDLNIELRRSGNSWVTLCPFHAESQPSFRISDLNSPYQSFKCYGATCAKHGDIITWVMLRNGMDTAEAVQYLSEKYNIDISSYKEKEDPRIARFLYIMNLFIEYTTSIENMAVVYEKVSHREISQESIEKFKVGWSPSQKEAIKYLIDKGVEFSEIKELELDKEEITDGTLVVPHTNIYGNIIGVKCRREEDGGAKYYGFSIAHPLYPQKLLFGLSYAKRYIYAFGGTLIGVEGDFDVIHMHDGEFQNTIGVGGSIDAITPQQIEQLKSIEFDELILMPDGDGPGRDSALKFAKRYKIVEDKLIRIASLDNGKDPDDTIRDHGINPISEAIEKAVHPLQLYIDHMRSNYNVKEITGIYQFLSAITNAFNDIQGIELDILAKYVASFVELDEEHIIRYIKNLTVDKNLYEYSAEETFIASVFSPGDFSWMRGISSLRADDFSVFNRDLADQIFIFYKENRSNTLSIDRFTYYLTVNGYTELLERYNAATRKMNDVVLAIDLIADRSARRKIRQASEATRIKVYDLSTDVDTIATQFKLGLTATSENTFEAAIPSNIADTYVEVFKERLESETTIVGVSLSPRWNELNALWSGIQLGEQVLITAPTGSGKSAIALEWAVWMSVHLDGPKVPSLFINGEMKQHDIISRILSIMTGIGNTRIKTGNLDAEAAKRVMEALAAYSKSCLYIETPRRNTLSEWLGAIEFHRNKHGTQYVYCDYVQLLQPETKEIRWQSYVDSSVELHNRCIRPGDELGIILVAQESEQGRLDRFGGVNFTAGSKQFGRDADKCLSSRKLTREQVVQQGIQRGNMQFYVSKDRSGIDDVVIDGFYSRHMEGNLRIGETECLGENEFWSAAELTMGGNEHER